MKNLSKISIAILILIGSFTYGALMRKVCFPPPPPSNLPVYVDTLPLENQGKINLAIYNGKEMIITSFEDFQYVAKKKRTMRNTIKNLEALFKRLED